MDHESPCDLSEISRLSLGKLLGNVKRAAFGEYYTFHLKPINKYIS